MPGDRALPSPDARQGAAVRLLGGHPLVPADYAEARRGHCVSGACGELHPGLSHDGRVLETIRAANAALEQAARFPGADPEGAVRGGPDAAEAAHETGPSPLGETESHRGAGLWPDQTGARISPVSPARPAEGPRRMGAELYNPQCPKTLGSAGEV